MSSLLSSVSISACVFRTNWGRCPHTRSPPCTGPVCFGQTCSPPSFLAMAAPWLSLCYSDTFLNLTNAPLGHVRTGTDVRRHAMSRNIYRVFHGTWSRGQLCPWSRRSSNLALAPPRCAPPPRHRSIQTDSSPPLVDYSHYSLFWTSWHPAMYDFNRSRHFVHWVRRQSISLWSHCWCCRATGHSAAR